MAKRRWHMGLAAALLVLAAAVAAGVLLARPREALTADPPGETLLAASRGLDEVAIDAAFDPSARTVSVSQTMTLTNRTGTAQRLLVLRTYANAFRDEEYSPAATEELYDECYPDGFSPGGLTFSAVKLTMPGGEETGANYSYEDDAHTVLRVSLPADWAANATLTLRMDYALLVPKAAYRYGESGGVWSLGNAFVIPSLFWDGAYRTDGYYSIGDPFICECRNYTVRVTAPGDYTVAGSAAPVREPAADGRTVTTFSAPAVRDFALCLSTGYALAEAKQDGVLVLAYALQKSDAQAMLSTAVRALACYGERYGPYPYPCFTVCESGFGFGGMEYPALAMIGTGKLSAGGDALEQTVAHETAHQWWYAAVGSDGYNQGWQDEALCEFSLLDYWGARYGANARAELQYSLADAAMRVTVPDGVTPGSPVDYFGDMDEYALVVYQRGAAALCALDTALGGGLDGFLAEYYRTYAFRLASRKDFETLLNAWSGGDWSPLLTDYLDTYIEN